MFGSFLVKSQKLVSTLYDLTKKDMPYVFAAFLVQVSVAWPLKVNTFQPERYDMYKKFHDRFSRQITKCSFYTSRIDERNKKFKD